MSETYPNDLLYSEDHEWVRRLDNDRCRLGITSFAQDELGEVVFVELPEVGQTFETGDELGTIESVKAVAEIYSPVAGEAVAVNEALDAEPERVNADVYGDGWLVELQYSSEDDLAKLMDAAAYETFVDGG
jgi:glycine cleavage system H protein